MKTEIEKICSGKISSLETQELVHVVEALKAKFQETRNIDLLDYKHILAKASLFIQNSAAQKLNQIKSSLYQDIATYLTNNNVAVEPIMGEFKHLFESNIQRLSSLITARIEINDPIITPFANQANINGYDVLDKIEALIKKTLQESRGQFYGDFEEDLEEVMREYLFEDEELSREFESRREAALEVENGLLSRLVNNSSLISQIQELDREIERVKTQIKDELHGYLVQRGVKDFIQFMKEKGNEFNFNFLDGKLKKDRISPLENRKKELVQEAIDQILSRKVQEYLPSETRLVISTALSMISSGQKSVKPLSDEDLQKFTKSLSETIQLLDSLKPKESESSPIATSSGSTPHGFFTPQNPKGPNARLPLQLETLVKRLVQLLGSQKDNDKELKTILKAIAKKQTPKDQMKIFSDDRISYDFFKKIEEFTGRMIKEECQAVKKGATPSRSINELISLSILFIDIYKPDPDANYDI